MSEGAKTQARSGQVHFHFTREAFKVLQQSYCKEIQSTTFLIHNCKKTQVRLLINILHHIQGKKCSPPFYVVSVFCLYLWCYHNTECLLVSNSRLDKTRKLMTSKLWFHFNFWHLINQKRHKDIGKNKNINNSLACLIHHLFLMDDFNHLIFISNHCNKIKAIVFLSENINKYSKKEMCWSMKEENKQFSITYPQYSLIKVSFRIDYCK